MRYQVMYRVGDENYQPILGAVAYTRYGARKMAHYWANGGFYEDTTVMQTQTHFIIWDKKKNRFFL